MGNICDHKASRDRSEGEHAGQQTWRNTTDVFQTVLTGSEMQLIFTITEFLKSLIQQVCILQSG